MSEIYDLCIIGAGMFGSAAARHASVNPCLKVVLIGPTEPNDTEKKFREIHSSHYDEGRIVLNIQKSRSLNVLAKKTIDRFRELEKLSGINFYHPVGCIMSAEINSEVFFMMKGVDEFSEVPNVDLSHGDTRKRFPYLHIEDSYHTVFDDKGAGYVNPRGMVRAEQKVALLQGCEIIREVVEDVSDLINGLHTITTETGKLIKTKRVLLCTGAFTKFKNLGPVRNLIMAVYKEANALIKIDQEESKRLSSMPIIIVFKQELGDQPYVTSGAYILPPILYPDGHYYLKIGPEVPQKNSLLSTLEEIKDWFNNGDTEYLEQYSKFLFTIIPNLKAQAISSKTCVTCATPTGLPYIDRVTPTVTVAVAGNGRGATICEEVGRIAAHLSVTGQWDSELPKSRFEVISEKEEHDLYPNGTSI